MTDRRLPLLVSLLVLLVGGAVASFFLNRPQSTGPVSHPLNLRADPVQTPPPDRNPIPFTTRTARLSLWPRAAYSVDARIISSDRYVFDLGSVVSPRDLSLAWGRLPEHLNTLRFSHGHRFYMYSYDNRGPFDLRYVERHSANVHVIPANDNVRKALLWVREKRNVRLTGFLVDITGSVKGRPFTWKTSITRDDTGGGSCEVMYVLQVDYEGRTFR